MTDSDLLSTVGSFLRKVRNQPSATPVLASEVQPQPEPAQPPDPFGGMSIEQLAEILRTVQPEIARLRTELERASARAELALAKRDADGLRSAWADQDALNQKIAEQNDKSRALREHLDDLTRGEITALNAAVRRHGEALTIRQQERANRLGEAVKVVAEIAEELRVEGGRASAAEFERAEAEYLKLVERCAGHSVAGRLQANEAYRAPRLDPVISILEQTLQDIRSLQR